MQLFDLKGQVALITGAASGLGYSIAQVLAEAGAGVVLSDINEAGCQALSADLAALGHKSHVIGADLGDKTSVQNLSNGARLWQGHVDILVCCGGMEGHVGPLSEASDSAWDQLMTVNLKSAQWLTSALIPDMAERGQGRVILVASIAGLRGNKALGLYGIAKAGLTQLARNLAVEWGPRGININAIAPGLIHTPFSDHLLENKAFMQRRMSLTPLRRMGKPEEIAATALFLASPGGGFITGQTVVVDGGTLITDGN